MTAVVLTQIIFEQEKAQRGFLPKSVLTNLVRAGGDTLSTLRRGLTLPLDLWRHVDEEIDRRVQTLISKGDLAKEEGQQVPREVALTDVLHAGDARPDRPGATADQARRADAPRRTWPGCMPKSMPLRPSWRA